MKIFLISHNHGGYDIYDSHVIAAYDESQVVKLSKTMCAEDHFAWWDSADIEEIGEYTGEKIAPFVIHSSFNAG